MGNCGSSPNCEQCYSPSGDNGCRTEIEVDADIAGTGVLVAFFLATLITCTTIFHGYLTNSLPESLLSETDEAIIQRFQNSYVNKTVCHQFGRYWLCFKSCFYHCLLRPIPSPRPPIPQKQRIEALTRFVLGFSDQQLITGLAILIAALANRCHLTLYEIRIVLCLAWFSATTHIVTLKVLQEYLYDHKVVRNWRAIAILTFVVLFCYWQVVVLWASSRDGSFIDNPAIPIQCIIDGQSGKRGGMTYGGVISSIFPLLWLMYFYATHTYDLYKDPRRPRYPIAGNHRVAARLTRRRHRSSQEFSRNEHIALTNSAHLQHCILISPRPASNLIRRRESLTAYRRSFLLYLPTIWFFLAYGITQTAYVTWFHGPKTTVDVRRMGFGQVVALALLAIPFLAATEVYNDARDAFMVHTKNCIPLSENEDRSEAEQLAYQQLRASLEQAITPSPLDTRKDELLTAIYRDLEAKQGFQNLRPFIRELCAGALLEFLAQELNGQPKQEYSRTQVFLSKHYLPIVAILSFSHSSISVFAAFTFNDSYLGAYFLGLGLLCGFECVLLGVDWLREVKLRQRLAMNQLSYLGKHHAWRDENSGSIDKEQRPGSRECESDKNSESGGIWKQKREGTTNVPRMDNGLQRQRDLDAAMV